MWRFVFVFLNCILIENCSLGLAVMMVAAAYGAECVVITDIDDEKVSTLFLSCLVPTSCRVI